MGAELSPEHVMGHLEKGRLAPVYLFFGPSEFRRERVLTRIRETFIPEEARDFNLHIFHGDRVDPVDVVDQARSLPFMASHRLIIVRKTDDIATGALEAFIPYVESPVESTCLIFVAANADFRKKFFRTLREMGCAVDFRDLYERQVPAWIRKTAQEMGFTMELRACEYLQQLAGTNLMELHSELEKLSLRYGKGPVGPEQVKEVAIHSRIYTIFEFVDLFSYRECGKTLAVLNRFIQEEGKEGILRTLGMLNRQIVLLARAKTTASAGTGAMHRTLGVPPFVAKKLAEQEKRWSTHDLERAVHLLHEADGLLKSGSQGRRVLEHVVWSLCRE